MIRDLTQFESGKYDLIIVGGGIYGAAICWEAVSRGLKVALFEKSDFASATSANSLKIIHGGFRYLQSADLSRVKESIREQKNLMQIAPHLVHPIPVLIPTYGHGLRGKEVFATGLKLFELIRSSEVQLDDPEKHIPAGRSVSKSEFIRLFPSLREKGLNGGVQFFDAQVYNSERLVLAFLQTACENGAHIANYAEVMGLIEEDQYVKGVEIKDVLSGDILRVYSKSVILAGGPWNNEILRMLRKERSKTTVLHVKAINLVTNQLVTKFAVGIRGRNQYSDGEYLANAKTNYLFIAPWRNYSIIGTAYTIFEGIPDEFEINENDIEFLKDEFNRVNPGQKLSQEDILHVHGGLLPLSSKVRYQRGLKLANKFNILDHKIYGYEGLLSVDGVKYTTARDVAQKTIDYIFDQCGYRKVPSVTDHLRLYGGEIAIFDQYLEEALKSRGGDLSEYQIKSLILNYGSVYSHVLNYFQGASKKENGNSGELRLLEAEIQYAVKFEMAQKLSDVVFRRTELGSAGNPGNDLLQFSAEVMGRELNWSQEKIDLELVDVMRVFNPTINSW